MKDQIKIHETAYVIANYRAMYPTVSLDKYARLWDIKKADKWVKKFVDEVSEKEPLTHSLRNRFFLEKIQQFIHENPTGVLVNFGAGLSMYPYLIDGLKEAVEIDYPNIVSFKKKHVAQWQSESKIPAIKTTYIGINYEAGAKEKLRKKLIPAIAGRPCFILIEGVIFFLDQIIADELFALFGEVQKAGDQIGSVSYIPDIEKTAVFKRLIKFMKSTAPSEEKFRYLNLSPDYYESLKNYRLVEHTDYCQTSARYAPEFTLSDPDEILNEHLYILQRK